MGFNDDDEAGSDPAESDPVNKRVNKYAKPLLPHDLYHFLQWQDLSPISFARIYNDRHSYVIKQYVKYSRQFELTCTFNAAISALEKYHKLTTKIIYSLIECCGGTVASTDDDTDVDEDEDQHEARRRSGAARSASCACSCLGLRRHRSRGRSCSRSPTPRCTGGCPRSSAPSAGSASSSGIRPASHPWSRGSARRSF